MMLNTMAPKTAAQNPLIVKPVTLFCTTHRMNPFIIRVNRPRVKIVIGKVIIFIIGLITALARPSTRAAINAEPGLSILKLGNS